MQSPDLIDQSIRRFDEVAKTWDSPRHVALARAVAGAILDAIPLTGQERALELGCGTGLVTGFLAGSLGSVLAVDSSAGMLEALQQKLHRVHLKQVRTRRVDLDREIPVGPFDLIYSSMTLHHIDDVAGLLGRLFPSVAPGGWLALADLAPEDGSFHGSDVPGVMHHGFQAKDLIAWLTQAGYAQAAVSTVFQIQKATAEHAERPYDVQLAVARRPR